MKTETSLKDEDSATVRKRCQDFDGRYANFCILVCALGYHIKDFSFKANLLLCFTEKGYCVLGDMCSYDHGTDPVVVDDLGMPSLLSYQGLFSFVLLFPPGTSSDDCFVQS